MIISYDGVMISRQGNKEKNEKFVQKDFKTKNELHIFKPDKAEYNFKNTVINLTHGCLYSDGYAMGMFLLGFCFGRV
jgi:hypothetical protein